MLLAWTCLSCGAKIDSTVNGGSQKAAVENPSAHNADSNACFISGPPLSGYSVS